jgi:RimJ/RimL family protein N-acetyltransferase
LYASAVLADAVGKDGEKFEIVAGANRAIVEQLRRLSLDESDSAVQDHTSDRKRFGEGSYEDWYAKDRVPFCLVHTETGALAAFAWWGPKPLGRQSMKHLSGADAAVDEKTLDAAGWHTLSYRSYPPFRGTGLMKGFVGVTMEAYVRANPGAKFWTITDTENIPSIKLAEALGFVLKGPAPDDPNQVLLIKE